MCDHSCPAFSRTEQLIGAAALTKLRQAKVAVVGLGGVGSYTVEALARSGIGQLLLIDHDRINVTNINRQLYALHETIGKLKVDVARDRIMAINPEVKVEVLPQMILPDTADLLPAELDYLVDAVDNVTAKIMLVKHAHINNIPVISCMGTGNKLDPTLFEIADIYDTSVCPLCRVMRRELKKINIPCLKVVYSKENPHKQARTHVTPASISFVPAVAGLLLAAEVIKGIISS